MHKFITNLQPSLFPIIPKRTEIYIFSKNEGLSLPICLIAPVMGPWLHHIPLDIFEL